MWTGEFLEASLSRHADEMICGELSTELAAGFPVIRGSKQDPGLLEIRFDSIRFKIDRGSEASTT